jgi:hypothetical protein
LLWLGTTLPALGADIQVPTGTSINDALAGAGPGDRVLVQAGTYQETVSLVAGVELRGGYDASFSEGSRDPQSNVTMIHGDGVRSCIVSGATVDSARVDGFLLRGAGGNPGGAIQVNGGSPVFSGNEISENRRSGVTGGAFIVGGSTARFENNVFRDNSTSGSGGAFRIENSAPEICGNTFEGNVARNAGGALFVFNSTVACSSNTIRDGLAGNGGGGAFCFQECPDGGIVKDTVIEDCEAGHGGAILIRDESQVSFEGTSIRRCSATAASGGYGGGVFVTWFSGLSMTDARFEDCSATTSGGGLYSFRSDLRLTGSDASSATSAAAFVNCTASHQGGGMWVFASVDTAINRVTGVRFSDCTAYLEGGGFYFEECELLFSENLLERCAGRDGGGGAIVTRAIPSPFMVVVNNTFYKCSATLDPAEGPGGGLVLMSPNNASVGLLAGNVISHTLSGACLSCLGGIGEAVPTLRCTTIFNDPANPSEATSGAQCAAPIGAQGNAIRDPVFCSPNPVTYRLQACGVELNCDDARNITGHNIRGVTDAPCACGIFSIEEASWGQIKAKYR